MDVKVCKSAGEFLATAEATLMRAEARNNLILRIARGVARSEGSGKDEPYFLCVEEGGQVLATALRTPPYPVIVQSEDGLTEPIEKLVSHLQTQDPELPGVNGTEESSRIFARLWAERFPLQPEVAMRFRAFELREVAPLPELPGDFRPAQKKDCDLLIEWAAEFQKEAVPKDPPTDVAATVRRLVDREALFLWELDAPVSMAANPSNSGRGAVLNLVYTPPEHRGRGYATACVAALSRRLLDRGHEFCALYADIANPISNRIYERMGYRPVGDWVLHRFKWTVVGAGR